LERTAALWTGKRVKTLYGPHRRFERESEAGMSEQGQCERETFHKIAKYNRYQIALRDLQREMQEKDQILCQILLELAKRIDTQEQRLILLENWSYKSGCPQEGEQPPC
jgi:hypothetical protein